MKLNFLLRIIDLLLALAVLPICSVLCFILCLTTICVDGVNPIFVQVRVGRFKRPFKVFKLRTLCRATVEMPSHQLSSCMLLKVGKFYRRYKLDELPQILNVILGQMSFVGPRPCLPTQTELIKLREKAHIFEVRPGITGLSQVRGIDMSEPNELTLTDFKAVQNMNLTIYLELLLATLFRRKIRVNK